MTITEKICDRSYGKFTSSTETDELASPQPAISSPGPSPSSLLCKKQTPQDSELGCDQINSKIAKNSGMKRGRKTMQNDQTYTAVCLLVSGTNGSSPSSTQNQNLLWVQEHDSLVDLSLTTNTGRSSKKIGRG
jgi:hypothetical protein